MATKKEERYAFIRKLAQEMAESGEYPDCLSIEVALRGKGYDEAKPALRDDVLRGFIDRACARARKATDSN